VWSGGVTLALIGCFAGYYPMVNDIGDGYFGGGFIGAVAAVLFCFVVYSRVPDERFLRICLNGITHTCMIHRWNEENKPHRNKNVVAMRKWPFIYIQARQNKK
jgi:hypothetical protein